MAAKGYGASEVVPQIISTAYKGQSVVGGVLSLDKKTKRSGFVSPTVGTTRTKGTNEITGDFSNPDNS